jgi:hypothetical protein
MSLESELEALVEAAGRKTAEIEMKNSEMLADRLKHEEELMKVADGIGAIEEVSRNLRERGTKMTLNEIKLMSEQI